MDPTALTRYAGNPSVLMLMTHLAALGITPQTGGPIGFTKALKPIYPIAGGDDAGLEAKIDALTAEIGKLGKAREETNPAGKAADGGRYAAALEGSQDIAAQLTELARFRAEKAESEAKVARKAEIDEAIKEALSKVRGGSKAAAIGDGSQRSTVGPRGMKASPVMRAAFGEDYVPGTALAAIAGYKGQLADGIDIEAITAAKATLEKLGMIYMGVPEASKATLGTTGATGGYVLPNNLVEAVEKPKTQEALYSSLVTVREGVSVRGVDQPYRMGAPTRMVAQNWGATKENKDEDYGSYTANLVTFARIYDLAKQYLRFSAGSAEADVLDELAKAYALAENYELIAGAGTGSVGSGDAITGVYTSLNATPAFLGYKTAKTGAASSSTIVGSFASALAEIAGLMSARSRFPDAIVVDSATYWTIVAQGSDAAGFWANPEGGPGAVGKMSNGALAYFGVPIFYDANLTANAASKIAIAAEWKAFKLYRGMEFRIDSSDVAGDRWDKNLVGFRGEVEFGFNAETAVHIGAAQLMTAVIP